MATLSVLKFNDPYGADRVMVALQGMQERELITLEDAAIVSWPQGNRKPKTRELHSGERGLGRILGFPDRDDLLRALPWRGDRRDVGCDEGRGHRRRLHQTGSREGN